MSASLAGLTTGSPAGAQVPAGQADYKGYTTGTVIHVDALDVGTTRVADVEVAFSGASTASKGTGGVTQGPGATAGTIVNEMQSLVQPTLANTGLDANLRGDRSFGRGSGLEVGLATQLGQPIDVNQILLAQRARASAPPNSGLVTNELGPLKIDPVAYASTSRGQAQAIWDGDNVCSALGENLSLGLGYVEDAQLVGTGAATGATDPLGAPAVATSAATVGAAPPRAVSQSKSVTRLVPQTDRNGVKIGDNFGLMTETRMTIAPVSLLGGAVTLELLGEWVLRAVATGIPGQAYVTYGPGTVSPNTPVLNIIQGGVIQQVLNLQQLLGQAGLSLPVAGLLDLAVGEDPRAIGGDGSTSATQSADGTLASGAVDVVRLSLLPGLQAIPLGVSLLDLRIGHMEARAQVPAGGIKCNVPVSKVANKSTVNAGEQFTYSITITNPFADCDLTNVRVVDTITNSSGVRFSIIGTTPTASAVGPNQVIWNDIGPIGPKQNKTVSITVQVASNTSAGQFTNNAVATGACATGSAQGGARITVPIEGETTVVVPGVTGGAELPSTGVDELPRTGPTRPALALAGLALLSLAVVMRRVRTSAVR